VIPPKNAVVNIDVLYPGQVLTATRTLNFIIPYIMYGELVGTYRGDILHEKFDSLGLTSDTDILFNDKLIDMQGYHYKTVFHLGFKQFIEKDDRLFSIEIQSMDIIAKKQNASFYSDKHDSEVVDILSMISQGQADIVLNLGSFAAVWNSKNTLKAVNTYETNGFCVLVPITPFLETLLKFITMPFHSCVWYALFLSLCAAFLIWQTYYKFFDNRMVSGLSMVMDILQATIQQSVNIRKGRFVLKMMLQLFLFMTIVIANIYQGVVTSILMDYNKILKVKSIHELLTMDYDFYSDKLFYLLFGENISDSNLVNKIKPLKEWVHNSNYT
jgi:hypothetical protein